MINEKSVGSDLIIVIAERGRERDECVCVCVLPLAVGRRGQSTAYPNVLSS